MTYAIAHLLLGGRAALIAAALAALSPGLAFFAVEARAYGLAVALVAASTLALLLATDESRSRWWWVGYAGFSAAAMYTHYTAAFVLVAQLGWLLWFRPAARRPALLANLAAAVAFVPWVPGLLADFDSPARANHELLAPFDLDNLISFLGTFSFGHPWASLGRPAIGLNEFYGNWAELALFGGLALAAAGALVARARTGRSIAERTPSADGGDRRGGLVLIGALAVAAPAGCALVSLIGNDLYLPRNLITSLPAVLIGCAALLAAAPLGFRVAALALVLGAMGVGAVSMLEPEWQRPDVRAAAELIDDEAVTGDAVLDAVWFAGGSPEGYSPPPFTVALDAHLDGSAEVTDAISPADVRGVVRAASGHRVWIVGPPVNVEAVREAIGSDGGEPAVGELFGGLIETEVVAVPIAMDRERR